MTKLTNKQAYEIIRDNTNWEWVFKQDVKFKDGWIFHRTRDEETMEYHTCRHPIDCYYIDSLHSMEIVGYALEPWSGCEVKDSPFISKNQEVVKKTLHRLNKSYQQHLFDQTPEGKKAKEGYKRRAELINQEIKRNPVLGQKVETLYDKLSKELKKRDPSKILLGVGYEDLEKAGLVKEFNLEKITQETN